LYFNNVINENIATNEIITAKTVVEVLLDLESVPESVIDLSHI